MSCDDKSRCIALNVVLNIINTCNKYALQTDESLRTMGIVRAMTQRSKGTFQMALFILLLFPVYLSFLTNIHLYCKNKLNKVLIDYLKFNQSLNNKSNQVNKIAHLFYSTAIKNKLFYNVNAL